MVKNPNVDLPDFKIDEADIPSLKLKSIHFQNFKIFEDYFLDLESMNEDETCKSFACFFGPNGCGKTTILKAIQLLFSRYDGYEKDRLVALLGRSVRHTDGVQHGIYGDDDFLITANIESSIGNYEVQINKSGFIKDHPETIKWIIYRLCYYARFDQELRQLQLPRIKWKAFKDLFESVTGFEIEEQTTLFDGSTDPIQADLLKKYVLGFMVHKKHETITHTECSDGEKKIIKSFSTLLAKEYMPQIILIDNIAMHVESGRHINLIQSMRRSLPDSQIFATTHSYQISRNFGDRTQLYDLRLINSSSLIKKEQWRLYISDELKDCVSKLKAMTDCKALAEKEIKKGEDLIDRCFNDDNGFKIISESELFIERVVHLFINDTFIYFSN